MNKISWVIWLIIGWLVFVVSLTTWWMIFSLRIIAQLNAYVTNSEAKHHHKMLVMEGSTLILLLIVGGVTLVYFALRERQRYEEVRHFFSTFSHDLKTSISRLVLQGERLFEKEKSSEDSRNFQKNLLALEMQLENSLHLAQLDSRELTLRDMDLKTIIGRIHGNWPDLKVSLQGGGQFLADAVALESIVKNLISNSVLHGQADEISLKVESREEEGEKFIEIFYSDNGSRFEGNLLELGQKPQPSTKGTGIGLYIVQQWVDRLQAKIEFLKSDQGSLQVAIKIPMTGGEET